MRSPRTLNGIKLAISRLAFWRVVVGAGKEVAPSSPFSLASAGAMLSSLSVLFYVFAAAQMRRQWPPVMITCMRAHVVVDLLFLFAFVLFARTSHVRHVRPLSISTAASLSLFRHLLPLWCGGGTHRHSLPFSSLRTIFTAAAGSPVRLMPVLPRRRMLIAPVIPQLRLKLFAAVARLALYSLAYTLIGAAGRLRSSVVICLLLATLLLRRCQSQRCRAAFAAATCRERRRRRRRYSVAC